MSQQLPNVTCCMRTARSSVLLSQRPITHLVKKKRLQCQISWHVVTKRKRYKQLWHIARYSKKRKSHVVPCFGLKVWLFYGKRFSYFVPMLSRSLLNYIPISTIISSNKTSHGSLGCLMEASVIRICHRSLTAATHIVGKYYALSTL